MKCYICNSNDALGWLCEEHANELYHMLITDDPRVIKNPKFAHHCFICGEFEHRVIIDFKDERHWYGYYCDVDIINSYSLFMSDEKPLPNG